MTLLPIVHRRPVPEPWAEGEKIPWDEPGFSRRMLREHLSQVHDAASRRFEIVDRHVDWIQHALLEDRPARVLDLGCGPGLYTTRLCRLGHTCVGIDFSPASIAFAREQADRESLPCTYLEQDIRRADYGTGYDLAMLLFGEFNVFRPSDAQAIVEQAHRALVPGGLLLLEVHTFAAVQDIGMQPPTWYAVQSGLFSDRPHLYLTESFWDATRKVSTERYFIIDAATGDVVRHAASTQAYVEEEYASLLHASGFEALTFYPSLTGEEGDAPDFFVIVARKPPS